MVKKITLLSCLVLCLFVFYFYAGVKESIYDPSIRRVKDQKMVCLTSFVSMFRNQVHETPDENAVVTRQAALSYRRLDEMSDQLASYLLKQGLSKGDFVGLSSFTDEYFIIGVLGILKSGGVYLPLDPEYPAELLHYIVSDASPKIILAQEDFKSLYAKSKVPIMDLEKAIDGGCADSSVDIPIYGDDPAYVVYTSGSTGKPKGIVVAHRSLPNIGISHRPFYPPKMKSLISGGICFDASILAIFHSLLNGGSLYLSNFGADQDIQKLCDFIQNHPINFMICVPSLYQRILHGVSQLPNLLSVSLTGEMIPNSLCVNHMKQSPNAFLYNEYGPTECAIGASVKKIYDPAEKLIYTLTVGRPIANTKIHILNDDLTVCSCGDKGEIYIEGIGLAKGYLNNKVLTQQSFIEVALDKKSKTRLYKTGDLGRYTSDGELEFLGRKSHNVVVNDQVVYIGEIEGAIYRHPEIKGAIVVKEGSELVAYITSITSNLTKASLKDFLASLLPEFMVPKKIVCLEKFPLSPNGKIDKKTLFASALKESGK